MAWTFTTWVVVGLAGLSVTLWFEFRERPVGTAAGKLLAASAYLAAAWINGAASFGWGRFLLAGMACCWVGDLLLVSRRRTSLFLLGLLAFLSGHVLYSVAFLARGQEALGIWFGILLAVPFMGAVLRWLWPHLDQRMRPAVVCYVLAISTMAVCAAGSFAKDPGWLLLAGAILFVLSDLAVARNRFVTPGFGNRAWGLPVYFLAQFLLAASVMRG